MAIIKFCIWWLIRSVCPSFSENNTPVCKVSTACVTDKAEMFVLIANILDRQILMLLPKRNIKEEIKSQGKNRTVKSSIIGNTITVAGIRIRCQRFLVRTLTTITSIKITKNTRIRIFSYPVGTRNPFL